jgi:hypothetical protein
MAFWPDEYDDGYEFEDWDAHPYAYGSEDEDGTSAMNPVWIGIARIPLILLAGTAAGLKGCQAPRRTGNSGRKLPRAWMCALAQKFPDTSLGKLRSRYPCLLPNWLLQELESCQVWIYKVLCWNKV